MVPDPHGTEWYQVVEFGDVTEPWPSTRMTTAPGVARFRLGSPEPAAYLIVRVAYVA
jgi:hypothetical protein